MMLRKMRIEGSSNCSRFGNQYDTIDIFVSQLVDHYNSLPQTLNYVLANTQLINDMISTSNMIPFKLFAKTSCPIYLIQSLFSRFQVDFSSKAMKWVSEFKLTHNNVSGRKVGSDPN